jgi:hypothetical protein
VATQLGGLVDAPLAAGVGFVMAAGMALALSLNRESWQGRWLEQATPLAAKEIHQNAARWRRRMGLVYLF